MVVTGMLWFAIVSFKGEADDDDDATTGLSSRFERAQNDAIEDGNTEKVLPSPRSAALAIFLLLLP